MENSTKDIVLLRYNHIMEYDWGSSDPHCLISQLRKQPHSKYAELWMGTHPKGSSKVSENETLAQYLEKKGTSGLPFLYKILCIEKALSIQLHPNKEQAELLFKQKPHIYADDNEKPEMFFTLTQFQCLFGIITAEELAKLMEISPFCNLKTKNSNKIKEIIVELLAFGEEQRRKMVQQALKNIGCVFPERSSLLQTLHQQFPSDEGILVSCLLKYKVIPPGKCFAIAAGVPHAYIKGTCLEIMKTSDNVVRLGLTPKLKDVETMLSIMKDDLGLDGLEVEKTQHGFIWNNLLLNPIEIKDEPLSLQIAYQSIGIIFSGNFSCSEPEFNASKGSIFFIQPGTYKTKGQCTIYLGAFAK